MKNKDALQSEIMKDNADLQHKAALAHLEDAKKAENRAASAFEKEKVYLAAYEALVKAGL